MGKVIPINRGRKVRPKKKIILTDAQMKRLKPIYMKRMGMKLRAKLQEMRAKKT